MSINSGGGKGGRQARVAKPIIACLRVMIVLSEAKGHSSALVISFGATKKKRISENVPEKTGSPTQRRKKVSLQPYI